MSKATRIRRENAREKIAAQRAAARRAEVRNRFLLTGGSILAVVVVVVAFIVIKATQNSSTGSSGGATGTALPASVIKDVTSVPASTLNAVGAGTGQSNKPKAISGSAALTTNGKPEILYVGAEYCPFCAAERWPLTVALSRFGTFSGLHGIHSAGGAESFPKTPTLTYYKSSFTSKYLVFTPVEEQTVTHATLQAPTSAQQALLTKYDNPPYVSSANANSIPFVDIGNKMALLGGSSFIPSVLAGKTWSQVAAALQDPSTPIAKEVLGAANYLTAAICKVTNDKPATVCGTSMIKTLQGQI